MEDRCASCEGMSGDGGQNDTPRLPCAARRLESGQAAAHGYRAQYPELLVTY